MSDSAWVIFAYFVLVPLVVFRVAKASKSSSDWATGGSRMGVGLIAVGIAGTRIGGVGTYGVAGDVMQTGLWNMWYGVTSLLALVLVGVFFAIPYRRLKLTTVGEIFDRRFGSRRSQVLTSLCVQTEYFIINIIEPYIIGLIVAGVLGIPLYAAIYIGSAVIIFNTVVSGLRGSAIANLIHCTVIIGGLGALAYVALQDLGGWQNMVEKVDHALLKSGKDVGRWWSFIGLGILPIVAMFMSATLHTPAASIYVNFATSARTEKIVWPAFLLAGVLAAIMPMLSGLLGIEALANYGADSSLQSYASITRLATDTGPILGGIALAAILAALISSGGPILLASATMFVNDWLPGAKSASNAKKLRMYRMTSVAYGLLAATIAVFANFSSVLKLLLFGFAMVVPPAIAIGYILYDKRTSEAGAYWGILSGYALGLLAWIMQSLVSDIGWMQHEIPGRGFAPVELLDPAYWGSIVPLIVVPFVSRMSATASSDEQKRSEDFYRQISAHGNADGEIPND